MVNKRKASTVGSFLLLSLLMVFFLIGIRAYITKASTVSALRQTKQYIRDIIHTAYATTDYITDDTPAELLPEIRSDTDIYEEIKNELEAVGIHFVSITIIDESGNITGDTINTGNNTNCIIVYYVVTDWFGEEHTGVILAGRTEME